MAEVQRPTPELLRVLLRYEQDTGHLYWLVRPVELFPKGGLRVCNSWNAQWAGERADRIRPRSSEGYLEVCIFARRHAAHRVAWAIQTGEWPTTVDHINGDRTDNRWSNLRDVDDVASARNKSLQRNNTSGVLGVSRKSGRDRWVARIGTGEGRTTLGTFKRFEDAVAARLLAEEQLGYHPNHGRRSIPAPTSEPLEA